MIRVFLVILAFSITACASNAPSSISSLKDAAESQQKLRQQLQAHFDQGQLLYKSGELDMARIEFNAMLDLKADDPNANYRLGTIAFKQGQFEDSATYFETVIKVEPKNFKAHYNLAAIRLMQAENHFKYYAALVEPDTDLAKVSKLIADIDAFNSKRLPRNNENTLEQLATSLKK